jgi:hypothetical protein
MILHRAGGRSAIAAIVLSVCCHAASYVLANDPATKPESSLVRQAGAAAYDALRNEAEPNQQSEKRSQLVNLATWQVKAGDMEGARRTLVEARAAIDAKSYEIPDLIALSVRAGDLPAALAFVQTLPEDAQLRALGKLAAAQVKNADAAGADRTAGLVDALLARSPRDPAPTTWRPGTPNMQTQYGRTLADIGSAFAAAGDTRRASALAAKIADKGAQTGLLAAIAKAQYKAGNRAGAAATLRQLRQDAEAFYDKDPFTLARILSRALASAGDIEQAIAVIAALPVKRTRDTIYGELADALARDGDISEARRIADITPSPDGLILIAKEQQREGRIDEARKTLADALQALGKSSLPGIDQSIRIQRIVQTLADCGAFAEAVALSKGLDELNRPNAVLEIVNKEIKRGDREALRVTVPVALEIARTTRAPDYAAGLSVALAKAGFGDDAKTALGLAQGAVGRLSGWQRVDGLNAVRSAQATLGDKDGVAVTDKAVEELRAAFLADLARAGGQGPAADVAKLVELALQADAAEDPKAEHELLEKVIVEISKSGMDPIRVIAVAGRYDPQLQKLRAVHDSMATGDFAAAMATINSLKGRKKDGALLDLVRAEIAAGQYRLAFDSAGTIRDHWRRARAFTGIVRAASTDAP